MNLRDLEYFLAVVDNGSISRAATALHVAQPSISQVIRRLERDLGVELFRRLGRGATPTAAGEALVGPARQVVRDLVHARAVAKGFLGLENGRLDLAAVRPLATNFVAAWIGDFRRRYPGIIVRLHQHDDSPGGLASMVRSGDVELAFTTTPVRPKGVQCGHIGAGDTVLALPPGLGDDLPDPVPLSEISGLPYVRNGEFADNAIESALIDHDVETNAVVETMDASALVPLIVAGAGAALLPLRQALDARRRGAILRATEPTVRRPIYILYPRAQMSAAATEFLAQSRHYLARWEQAMGEFRSQGMGLVDAAVAVDAKIEEAYARRLRRLHKTG